MSFITRRKSSGFLSRTLSIPSRYSSDRPWDARCLHRFPGVTSQTITVPIANDGTYEGAESFFVNLSGATNATIADGQGIGTILDNGTGTGGTDDDRPSLSVSSPSVAEKKVTMRIPSQNVGIA